MRPSTKRYTLDPFLNKSVIDMAQTSVHLKACDIASSEIHNEREKELDYVRKDLTHLNESFSYIPHSLSTEAAAIRKRVKEQTGRKLQKNAVPIKEGVIVIAEHTTMADLRRYCQECQERFGIVPLQIHIHRDEGHSKSKTWKPNLHAHIVWSMYREDGKNVRLGKQNCRDMQTIAAEVLGMERGKPSDKKHLSALQYKIEQQEKRLTEALEKQRKAEKQTEKEKDEVTKLEKQIKDLKKDVEARSAALREFGEVSYALEAVKAEKAKETAKLAKIRKEVDDRKQDNASLKGGEAKAKDAMAEDFPKFFQLFKDMVALGFTKAERRAVVHGEIEKGATLTRYWEDPRTGEVTDEPVSAHVNQSNGVLRIDGLGIFQWFDQLWLRMKEAIAKRAAAEEAALRNWIDEGNVRIRKRKGENFYRVVYGNLTPEKEMTRRDTLDYSLSLISRVDVAIKYLGEELKGLMRMGSQRQQDNSRSRGMHW